MVLREVYQKKADAQLCEWQTWIEQYKGMPGGKPGGSMQDHQRFAQRLEDCYRTAQARLADLASAQAEQWELAKQAVERAMIDLKLALEESGAANSARRVRVQDRRSYMYEPFARKG